MGPVKRDETGAGSGSVRFVNTKGLSIRSTSLAGQEDTGAEGSMNLAKAPALARPAKNRMPTPQARTRDADALILPGGGFGASSMTRNPCRASMTE